ncbi:MAG: alpha/beta hydrolase [Candidatus Sericytochromatia bacterium]|nr:alpha/beta hydrolase [Candidatus Sericytochromatia bacterium]
MHHLPGLQIPGFDGIYPLSIYTPPGYGQGDRAYPVAYMFDGQNLFFDGGTQSGGWHLHEALDRRARLGATVPVVVGIHHGGATRLEELTPGAFWGRTGRGAAFLDGVITALMPQIQADWRILSGPENTMIGGSSLGGLMAVHGFFQYPELFGRAMAMPPAISGDPSTITDRAAGRDVPAGSRLYLDAGAHEGWDMLDVVTRFVDHLETIGFTAGPDLMWFPDAEGDHSETTWRRHVPAALDFLYD